MKSIRLAAVAAVLLALCLVFMAPVGAAEAEAEIGTAQYDTLENAFSAVNSANGGSAITIKLLSNVDLNAQSDPENHNNEALVLDGNKVLILDLNGYNLSVSGKRTGDSSKTLYAISNYGELTVKDSSKDGTGVVYSRGIQNFGVMSLESGTIISCDTNGGAGIWNEGTLTINGGTLKVDYVGSSGDTYSPGCLYNDAKGTVVINRGTFTSESARTYAIVSYGTLTINNVVVATGNHGCVAITGGTVTINDGTFHAKIHYALYVSDGAVTVNGGTFTTDYGYGNVVVIGNNVQGDGNPEGKPQATLNGGTFGTADKPVYGIKIQLGNTVITGGNYGSVPVASSGTLRVIGGTFTKKADGSKADVTAYLNPVYTQGDDGTVSYNGQAEAKVTSGTQEIYYATLTDAIAAANSDDTVTLLKDVEVGEQIKITKDDITLTGSYTITPSLTWDGDESLLWVTGNNFKMTGVTIDDSSRVKDAAISVIGLKGQNAELTENNIIAGVSTNHRSTGILVYAPAANTILEKNTITLGESGRKDNAKKQRDESIGIRIYPCDTPVKTEGLQITGNTITKHATATNPQVGILIDGAQVGDSMTITGNTFDLGKNGIILEIMADGAQASTPSLTLTSNTNTIISASKGLYLVKDNFEEGSKGFTQTLTVTGDVTGDIILGEGTSLVINKGTFSTDVSAYVAEDKICVQKDTSTFVVELPPENAVVPEAPKVDKVETVDSTGKVTTTITKGEQNTGTTIKKEGEEVIIESSTSSTEAKVTIVITGFTDTSGDDQSNLDSVTIPASAEITANYGEIPATDSEDGTKVELSLKIADVTGSLPVIDAALDTDIKDDIEENEEHVVLAMITAINADKNANIKENDGQAIKITFKIPKTLNINPNKLGYFHVQNGDLGDFTSIPLDQIDVSDTTFYLITIYGESFSSYVLAEAQETEIVDEDNRNSGSATDTGSGNYQYYPRDVPANGIISFGTSKVITGMELPAGSSGKVTLNIKPTFAMPENGFYAFEIDAPGYNTDAKINGGLSFQIPVADLEAAGWTAEDIVLFHGTVGEDGKIVWEALPTNLVKNENGVAYYKAAINGCSPFYIGFVKDGSVVNTEVVDPTTPETPETPVTPDEPEVLPPVDEPETPEQPTESPAPILAVLAGLGAAVVLRRK